MTAVPDTTHAGDPSRIARVATLACAPLPPIVAVSVGTPLLPVLIPTVIFAAMALASARSEAKLRPLLLTVALVGICIAFTAAFSGHPWQIDTHMVYFAALAIVATTESLVALALGVVLIALHHLGFGFFLPALVYPSADVLENLGRTVLHALIVLFEAAVLFLSIQFAAKAKREVEVARADLRQSANVASQAQQSAERARERAVLAAEKTRHEGRQAAVAIEEISAAARQVADNSASSQKLVSLARGDAETSGAIIARTKDAMTAIRESSDQISRIVELIDEIARRTDLLALNAAVESARAGDAGRGFAVVANEVRKLAQQSADATLQIRGLVKTSAGRVNEGADLVNETGTALQRIVASVSDIDERMRDIAVGAAEQSTGLDLVTVSINRIDEISVDGDDAVDANIRHGANWGRGPTRSAA